MTRLPPTSLLALLILAFAPLGCGLQGKGQYCDSRYKNGSLDCDTSQGLVCNTYHVCCPQNEISNICNPTTPGASTGGAGGNGAGGNGAGGGDDASSSSSMSGASSSTSSSASSSASSSSTTTSSSTSSSGSGGGV